MLTKIGIQILVPLMPHKYLHCRQYLLDPPLVVVCPLLLFNLLQRDHKTVDHESYLLNKVKGPNHLLLVAAAVVGVGCD